MDTLPKEERVGTKITLTITMISKNWFQILLLRTSDLLPALRGEAC